MRGCVWWVLCEINFNLTPLDGATSVLNICFVKFDQSNESNLTQSFATSQIESNHES